MHQMVIVLSSLIRARLLGAPLEPDEGEYVHAGQLLLQGSPPYQLASFGPSVSL